MPRDESQMFGRGETFYQGGTIDSANLGGVNFEGQVRVFEDLDYSGGQAKPTRSNRLVKCMCVRNVSAIALLPKRLVTLQKAGTDGRFYLGRVDGYATVDAAPSAFPVDEFLPAAGVPVNDLFWIVIEGPATVLTPLDAGADNVVNVGDILVSLTAATSGATTAGRVATQVLTGATAVLGGQVQNRLGYALSARTTANTGADLLMDVRKW